MTTTYKQTLIDVPKEKGIHIKKAGNNNEKYVYKYTKHYRNKNGQTRHQATIIGKHDQKTNKMHPNNNYYKLYQTNPPLQNLTIQDYGYTYLIQKISQTTGLLNTLTQTFNKQHAQDIITTAAYMIKENTTTTDTIEDWQQKTYTPLDYELSPSYCSRLFASITNQQRQEFFKQWIKKFLNPNGSVCYDVTSISSYSQTMISVEPGYNRDHEHLNQFNLGMFCDEQTKIPLYYTRYNGSLTDKTNLSYVLTSAKSLGIEHVKMILDRGFWSKACFKALDLCCETFILGMPLSLKASERILANISGIESYANELAGYPHVYCVSVDEEFYGVKGRVLVFYDSFSHVQLCEDLSVRVEALKVELMGLKRYPVKRLSRYEPYFMLTRHSGDGGFDFVVDVERVECLRRRKGFFLLFSSDLGSLAGDVLYYYRAKDADEKLFAQVKVELEGNRVRTHSEVTTDGKVFVLFVACVLRSFLLSKLSGFLLSESLSLKKVFSLLSNIVVVSSGEEFLFVKALTKKQKQILAVFNVEKDIEDSLKKLTPSNCVR